MHSTPHSAPLRLFRGSSSDEAAFTVVFALGAVVLLLLALAYPLTALVISAWIALAVVIRVLGPLAVSPAFIVAVGLAVIGLAGRVLYPVVVDAPKAAGIQLPADPELLDRGFYALTAASLAVSLGAIAVGLFTRRPGGTTKYLRSVQMPRRIRSLLTLGAPVPAIGLIYMRDITQLLERGTYRYEGLNGGLAGGLTAVLIVSLVLSGYLWGTQGLAGRGLVLLNIILSTGYLLALGTRMFAAVPVLIAAGYYLARMNRRSMYVLAVCALLSLWLVPLPMYWRVLDEHGLFPYLAGLGGYAESDFGWGTTAKTILISVPITGASAALSIPAEALGVALDPRGGRTAGWYDMYPHLMLNQFSPTSGVGELLNHGAGALAGAFLVIGGYLGFLDRHMRRVLSRGHHMVAFAHAGLMSLCLVYLVQYHLRIGMRMLYYSAALWIAYALWRKVNPVLVRPQTMVARYPQAARHPTATR